MQYILTNIYIYLIIGRVTPVFKIHMLHSALTFLTHAEVSSFPIITAFCGMKTSVLTITLLTSNFCSCHVQVCTFEPFQSGSKVVDV